MTSRDGDLSFSRAPFLRSLASQNQAAEIWLWSMRRGGLLIREMQTAGVLATARNHSGAFGASSAQLPALELKDVGLTKMQSHGWQALAGGAIASLHGSA